MISGRSSTIDGVLIGHAHNTDTLTGCTVLIFPSGTTCGVDVRGGAPGTRETDLLAPHATVQHIDAICLAGGSAFGLAATTGVMSWLREHGRGFETPIARVPIVPSAVLFDLALGRADSWPDADMGYAACVSAQHSVEEGCVGAGIGASVGKLLGVSQSTKSGLGYVRRMLVGGVSIAALAVTNAFGDVCRNSDATLLAGARLVGGGFANTNQMLCEQGLGNDQLVFSGGNTTLAVVMTDAKLDKAGCTTLAIMAQDALARTIRPVHTAFDGDVVFAAATGVHEAPHSIILGTLAAQVLAEAIERSVHMATSMGGLPAASDLVIRDAG